MMGTIHRNKSSVTTWLALIIIIAGFCLAYPSAAEAAVEVDAVSSNSTIGTSITIPHTTSGTNRLMLVGVSFNNDNLETVTGVTYNSVPLTLVGTAANADDSRIEIWRLIAPDTGTYDVVVTFSADLIQEGFAGVVTFTGVHQTTPLGTFASAAADGITATVDVSSATGELVFDVLAAEYATSATVGAGQTERWNIILSSSIGAGSTEPGAATVTMSWTLTAAGDHWAIGAVPVKPATTTIGGGTSPANKDVAPSSTNNAVDSFTLVTDSGTDTVTALTVTFTGTDVNDVAASGVKIYEDNGGTANEWDATDTLIDTTSFSGTTASFTGLNISVDTSATQYLVTYDIAAGATDTNTLQGAITAATVTNTLVNNDTTDAILTITGGCSYSYRRPITFDNTKVSGTADLTNFPVLISLSGDWLKTTTADPTNGRIESASGYDIIFKDSTETTQLDHEIELYDGSASGGTLLAWVRIPTLSYNTDTVIYMYYGSACPSSSTENITGVWDSNYVAVWHFEEASGTVYDSTSNNNDGTPQGTPSYVDAKIGKAYNTTNGYFSVPYSSSLDFVSGSMYIECWAKYDDFTGGTDPGIFVWNDGNNDMFGMNDPTTPRFRISATSLEAGTASAATWYYFVGRYDGNDMYAYHNTSQLGSVSKTGNTAFADGTNTIGYRSGYTSYIHGIIDELRISKTDRGMDYMTTTYNNQNSPATFYTVGSEDYCDYSSWRQITIDNTKVSGIADLSNFPLLVSLSGDWLKTTTADPTNGRIENASGYDIIFKDTSGTQLDHEIEEYDGTNGTFVAWVRIPTLSYNIDTVIYVYYGSTCISSSQENITGVWDSNYKAVWHLKEDPSGTPPQINDSTLNNNDGTTGGTMIPGNQVAGKMNGSVDFDGTDDYATMPTTGFSTSAGTVEAWVNIDSFDAATCEYVFSHCQESPTSDRVYIQLWNDNTWGTGMGDTYDLVRGSALSIDTWYHLVITWDGTNVRGYLNGSLDFGPTLYTGLSAVRDIFIMAWNTPAQWADGTLDELRLSSTDRTADWILTSYNNQNDSSTFYIVGQEGAGCSYSHRKPITILNSQVSGTADHTNFPALVNLTDTALRHIDSGGHVTNSSGFDIVFRASDETTQLDHEIEEYDSSAGTIVAWVRIPTLSYDTDTVIYMYYGNTCISTSQENVTGVWDSNYVGVWHLKETPTVDSYVYDSTTNNNDGTFEASMTSGDQATGKVNGSLDFDGSDDYITFPSTASLRPANITISAWVKANPTTSDEYCTIIGHPYDDEVSWDVPYFSWLINRDVSNTGGQYMITTAGEEDSPEGTPAVWDNTWHMVTLVYDGVTIQAYVDSQSGPSEVASPGGNIDYDASNPNVMIGMRSVDAAGEYYGGLIDEVRISDTDRSADWIQTEFDNQSSPATFYNEGSEESAGTVTLGNHAAGQETDNFSTTSPVTGAELFAFKLTNTTDSTVTVKKVLFPLSAVTGIVQGDFANLAICVDDDNDGDIEAGETTTVGGSGTVNAGVTDIIFSSDFTISASTTVNYIMVGDVSNLVENDTVTIDLGTSNVTITAGHVGGSAPTSATHTSDAACEYSSWRQITIDNTKVSGTSDLTNFPLLVSLSGDWLKTTTVDTTNGRIENASGYDIIFKDTSGTQLDHEIEEYDGTAGTLIAWVRIPTLSYNINTVIYMYYGNTCISTSQENASGVWDSNYVGVWHLKEDAADVGTSNLYQDSTSNANHGDDYVSATGQGGKIHDGQAFDGVDDYVGCGNNSSLDVNYITIEFWLNVNTWISDGGILSKGTSTARRYWIWTYGGAVSFEIDEGSNINSAWTPTAGQWEHLALIYNGTNVITYRNGAQENSYPQATGTIDTTTEPLLFGDIPPYNHFDGNLDEVRISNVVRSIDWIKTSFDNQNDSSTFYSVGEEGAGCSYSHRKQITILNSQVSGTADHTNFPALFSLTDTNLRHINSGGHVTNINGYDIVFRASDEITQLDHEIEEYDGTNGTVVAWVRIPTLSYNTDTVIYMYYGNTCISTSQENVTGVWDSNYVGVWHLKETPTVDSYVYDSTTNNNDGTFEASMTSGDQMAGQIDGSLEFDGIDDFIDTNYNTTLGQITISAWIHAYSDNSTDMRIVEKEEGTGSPEEVQFLVEDTEDNLKFARSWSTVEGEWTTPTGSITFNTWYHVAVTYDDSSTSNDPAMYIGGVSQSVSEIGTPSGSPDSNGERYFIGNRGGKDRQFDGRIDEVRISNIVRSADWIQTEFDNQSSPATFYNEGSEESAGTVTLGNHAAGQETDNFSTTSPVTGAELFAFKLTNTTDSTVTVKKVLSPLSAVTGIVQGDFANLAICVDDDNDGDIEAGETTTVGGSGTVNAGVTDIIFSSDFTISANTTVNYIMTADMSNLEGNDTVTIDLGTSNVTITAGHVGGTAPTSATHTTDDNCIFTYRRPITIQASQVSGTADHTDFPVLISLTGTWLRTSTADPTNGHVENANGYDIIFRDSSGTTQLDHEIEDYDGSGSGGTLVAWVRIPTLKYNENTVIYMYYGNPCIDSSTENITGVWDANFVGVWHLKEEQAGSTTDDLYQDSTSNNNDGDDRTDATAQNGKINGGQQFGGDADADYVQIPHHSTLNLTGDMTISFWMYATENSLAFNRIVDKGYTTSYYFGGGNGTNDLTFYLYNNAVFDTDDNTFTINEWHYAAVTYNSTTGDATLILDGTESGSGIYTGGILGNESTVYISHTWPDYDFAGYIDEVRISNTDRTVDWLKTEHNNQNDPATFYNVGNEETPAPTAVDLISFTATGQEKNVIVEWETAQEIDNLGFNLYRSTELGGTYSKLNRSLVPGLLSSVTGQQYTYIDKDVIRSVLYYYMLEDVDLDGTRTMHGPICVDWDADGIPDDYIEDPEDDTDTGEEDPEVSIPDTEFDELESDLSDWTPSNIGGSASWVKLSSFKAYEQDDGVALEWETSYEVDNLGFHVYRELDGKFYRITPDLVPGSVFSVGEGSELPAGQSYAYWDALSQQTGREFYWLDSVELNGGRASFGPIDPEISGKPIHKGRQARFKSIAEYQVSRAQVRGKIKALREELSVAPVREQKSRAIFYEVVPDNVPSEPRLPPSEEQWALSAAPGVKIYVKEDGWYRVGEPELVAAGLRPGIDPRYLQLYADGVEQSILVTGDEDGRFDPSDAVEFYGTALDTPFTDAHVYWLVVGSRPGRRLDTPFTDIRIGPDKGMRVPRGLRGRGGTLSFPYTVELKERTFYFAALKSGERDNFFGSVISTDPVNQLLTLPNRAPSSPRGAILDVGLQGATDVYHQVRILLNYRDAYDVGFTGQLGGRVEIPISQGSLLEGDNVVTLAAQGGSMDVSLVDHVRITYWRTYTADDDVLQFKATGGEWLSIGGFSSPGIRVVDITDSVRMLNVRGKVKPDGSDYAITIKIPGGGERTLLAFTEEKIKSPAGIAANIASSWHEISQGAEVIIIGHSDLLESVRPLKELREQQGLSVVLVDVEDLYDEFNFGAKSPWAMKDFLAQAYLYWNPQPRYLILVGDTSYDPRNYLGYGEFDLMPTKFVDTENLKTASDDWFVDFDDDELAEMAVGRLPAASAGEVTAVVAKIINYEGYASLMNEVLLVSDTNDFFNFEQASAKVAELIPGSMTVNEIFRGRSATAKSDLLDLLNQGQLLVNYFGHGSTQIWKGNLLTYSDALSLTNSPNLPFFVSTTCLNGFFQDPYSESLAEALLKAEFGGAVAVWTSSGLTDPEEQVPLNKELITLLFNGEGLTIGEAAMRAKQAVTDSDIRRTWILFGDPTLKLKK